MLFKCIKRLPNKPRVIAAVGLMWGFFVSGYIKRTPQVNEPDLIGLPAEKNRLKNYLLKKASGNNSLRLFFIETLTRNITMYTVGMIGLFRFGDISPGLAEAAGCQFRFCSAFAT